MKTKLLYPIFATALLGAALPASARSLLYYFDFDRVENGALVYDGVNKGTGTDAFTLKVNGGSVAPSISNGALGSSHAFCSSTRTSLWLGSDRSIGCGTTRGFTISFWMKATASHERWSDFFGFKVEAASYRFEYRTANSTDFTVYSVNSIGSDGVATLGRLSEAVTSVSAGVWTHVAIVCAPGTNSLGSCALYIGGMRSSDLFLEQSGELRRIEVGNWVIGKNGLDRTTTPNSTGIDELAVFDYPATAEQVKWLAHYRPGQPVDGPGREMPYAWHFDTTNETAGVLAANSGTSPREASPVDSNTNTLATASAVAALGSRYSMKINNFATWCLRDDSGLGATAGSGYTFSLWVNAPQKLTKWTDFFTYCLGETTRNMRLEWDDQTPSRIRLYGALPIDDEHPESTNARGCVIPRTVDAWDHLSLVWNRQDGRADIYANGTRVAQVPFTSPPSDSTAVTEILLGSQSRGDDGTWRIELPKGSGFAHVDEFAMFNHALSPDQVAWLGSRRAALPPLDATNLVRTVSADGAWSGHLASWGVRELSGGAWADAGHSSIWPACEDVDVEATVALAAGVTITNDTFVTPKRLALAAATGADLPAAATLKSTSDSLFAPQELEIGDGIHLTVPLYAVSTLGTLTFGTNAKIVFDVSNYNEGGTTNALTAGAFALPSGESDVLAHFAVTDNRFTLSLSADGKTVLLGADSIPVTATWTGAGDGTSLDSGANWECRNGAGTVLPGDTLPGARTVVVVSSGAGVLNAHAGTVFPWPYLRIEAASATLAADVDWRGFGEVILQEGAVIDMNGHRLTIVNAGGSGRITDTAATGGELRIDVPESTAVTNSTAQFAGTLRLVKEGAGVYAANVTGQPYTGGTEIREGVFSCLPSAASGALGATGSELCVSTNAAGVAGVLEMKGGPFLYNNMIVMRGGIIRQVGTSGEVRVRDWMAVNTRLEADSAFDAMSTWGVTGQGTGGSLLDLGGHTLSIDIKSGQNFYIRNAEIKNGVLDITGAGTFWSSVSGSYTANIATNADVRIASAFNAEAPLRVRGYEALYAGSSILGSAEMKVYGTFKPSAHNYFYGCTLQDGATIDLSARTNALNVVAEVQGRKKLTFAANATVYVKLGDLRVPSGTPVIRWTAETMPTNIDTLSFKNGDAGTNRSFVKKADGLYAVAGSLIIIY